MINTSIAALSSLGSGLALSLFPLTTDLPADAELATPEEQAEVREGTWYASERDGYLNMTFGEYLDEADRAELSERADLDEVPEDLQAFSFDATCNHVSGAVHVDEQATLKLIYAQSTAIGCPDTAQERAGLLLDDIISADPQLFLDDAGHLYLASEEGTVEMQREKPAGLGSSLSS